MGAVTRTRIRRNAYFDSLVLMRAAAIVCSRPEAVNASLMMGTAANKEILREGGLLDDGGGAAGPNDLIIAVRAEASALEPLLDDAELALNAEPEPAADMSTAHTARTLAQAGGANLALISTPGIYAAAEALKALKLGMHVFIFSDNVSIEDELMLKEEAQRRDLLVMGPDCGTSIINGLPLGFANVVRRGDVGLIGASGTGSQAIACLLDRGGAGLSQLIGVGSRDLSERVGARSMLFALEALDDDPDTRVIVLVSKPPAPAIADKVISRAARARKPVVVNFLGAHLVSRAPNVHVASTLEEAATLATALSLGRASPAVAPLPSAGGLAERLSFGRSAIRAIFSGGAFASEAESILGEVATSVRRWTMGRTIDFPAGHMVLDLGADEFTVGRPHPMIDPTLRIDFLRAAASAPDTAIVLFDVVLGTGSAADPAGVLAPTIRAASTGPLFVAFVCGTPADPQNLTAQEGKLTDAGVIIASSSTAAARLAAGVLEAARSVA